MSRWSDKMMIFVHLVLHTQPRRQILCPVGNFNESGEIFCSSVIVLKFSFNSLLKNAVANFFRLVKVFKFRRENMLKFCKYVASFKISAAQMQVLEIF